MPSVSKPSNVRTKRRSNDDIAVAGIGFTAPLLQPASPAGARWRFIVLPAHVSAKLPSRSQLSVRGRLNGKAFRATAEPDGKGGHWMKLTPAIFAGARDVVALDITPVQPHEEPEPKMPADLRKALAGAPMKTQQAWKSITPIARRDFVQWIVSAKQAQTRARRIDAACDMLAKGKRRPCCFDRSGMYAKTMCCPTPAAASPRSQ